MKLSKPTGKRRTFSPEFKAEAVRIARTPGKTIAQMARKLITDYAATILTLTVADRYARWALVIPSLPGGREMC